MTDKKLEPTGWIRYCICDKSGCGFDKDNWLYDPDSEDQDAIEEAILKYEDWTQHADSYTLKFWQGELPPVELIEQRIKHKERQIKWLQTEIEDLKGQLKMSVRKLNKDEEKAVQNAVNNDRIKFAEEFYEDDFSVQFREDFARRILMMEWNDIAFVSMESSVLDFNSDDTAQDTLDRLLRYYGVDCSDMKYLNLFQVMKRCYDSTKRN